MAVETPEWLTANEAVRNYGIAYKMLRKLIRDGVFTRGQFSSATKRPPIRVRAEELEAWNRGGVPAVAPVKAAFERSQRDLSAAHHDIGGEGG